MSRDLIYKKPTARSRTTNEVQRVQDRSKRSSDEEITLDGRLHRDRSDRGRQWADGGCSGKSAPWRAGCERVAQHVDVCARLRSRRARTGAARMGSSRGPRVVRGLPIHGDPHGLGGHFSPDFSRSTIDQKCFGGVSRSPRWVLVHWCVIGWLLMIAVAIERL